MDLLDGLIVKVPQSPLPNLIARFGRVLVLLALALLTCASLRDVETEKQPMSSTSGDDLAILDDLDSVFDWILYELDLVYSIVKSAADGH